MRNGTIKRIKAESGDQGTFSELVVGALAVYLGELPWRDDKHNISCIPPAPDAVSVAYMLKYLWSYSHGKKNYRFIKMAKPDGAWGPMPDGRDAVEIHSANLMGDIMKGYAAQVEGCGAPGRSIATFPRGAPFKSFTASSPTALVPVALLQDQKGVSSSVDALQAFEAELAGEDLTLTVSWI